jgi:hypothetical protein
MLQLLKRCYITIELEPTNGVITARRPEKDSSWLAGRALASRGSTQSFDGFSSSVGAVVDKLSVRVKYFKRRSVTG